MLRKRYELPLLPVPITVKFIVYKLLNFQINTVYANLIFIITFYPKIQVFFLRYHYRQINQQIVL